MTTNDERRRRPGAFGETGWPGSLFERVVPAQADEQGSRAAEQAPQTNDQPLRKDEPQVEETIVGETVELAGVYIISVAARLLEMHPQTLRKYERFGLIRPSRTAGALRLYSDQDLARLRIVRRLVEELGLNLAGVRLLMEVVSQLEQAINAVERDEASRQSAGAREAVAHMRAVLEFVHA